MNAKQVVTAGVVAAVLGFGPAAASAQEGPYFSLFWGRSSTDIDKDDLDAVAVQIGTDSGGRNTAGSSSLNDADSVWGVQVGYRFNRFVAAEAGYVDLGKANYVGNLASDFGPVTSPVRLGYSVHQRFLSSGPTIAVLGMIPLGERFDIYGRGGIYFADTRYRIRAQSAGDPEGTSTEDKAGTQELFGGLGFAWNINDDYGVRAEATHFADVGDDDRTGEASVTILTVG
ncbi:MAG TPA: outer membrane beta-barrel protein, partial [Lacipirellulaceae bacterium]